MKLALPCIAAGVFAFTAFSPSSGSAQIGGMIRGAVNNAAQTKIDNMVNCAVNDQDCIDKAHADGKKVTVVDQNGKPLKDQSAATKTGSDSSKAGAGDAGATFKTYQNYDFVPGTSIIFDDDFRSDADGEFPAHWKLLSGQGVINMMNGDPVFALTEGNYVKVAPRLTTDKYLTDTFTVEFDFYPKVGSYEKVNVFLNYGDNSSFVAFGPDVSTSYFEHDFNANYPGGTEGFTNKWHHAALVFKGGQMKAYEDQYRVLVVPDVGKVKPEWVSFGGIGSQDGPILFKNVRIANGGGMKMIDELTKSGRIVTHGILFDVNKPDVKPQSMGTIKAIVAMLQADPSIKVEIGGHTDADGDAAHNMTLSQSRADAVKQLLVAQGIDGSRMTTKGYGATKPIAPNTTPEGKANNRRVELVKN